MTDPGNKRPAFQFYPKDWMADTDLMACSPQAQGLWIYLLCLMHYCEPYGHLADRYGNPVPVHKLARLFRVSEDEITTMLNELGEAGVYSTTTSGVLYSRRMVADYERYAEHRDKKVRAGVASGVARRGNRGVQPVGTEDEQPRSQKTNPSPSPSPSTSASPTPSGCVGRNPPTVEQVAEYMLKYMGTKGYHGAPPAERFHNHFTSNGWKVSGRAPMKSWEAAARNWIRNDVDRGKLSTTTPKSTTTDVVNYINLDPSEKEVAMSRYKGLLTDAEDKLGGDDFDTWVSPLFLVGVAPGDVLVLGCDNRIVYEWVRDHLGADLEAMNGPLRVVHTKKPLS